MVTFMAFISFLAGAADAAFIAFIAFGMVEKEENQLAKRLMSHKLEPKLPRCSNAYAAYA